MRLHNQRLRSLGFVSPKLMQEYLATAVLLALFCLTGVSAATSTETVLYTFGGTPDGAAPYSALIRDKSGKFYGVTAAGGAYGQGTVFELGPNGSGGWIETILHDFVANGTDGESPGSGLTLDAAGNLYGTTIFGGTHVFGTVYELSPSPNGTWTETILYNFTGGVDGGLPQYGSLVFDSVGNLYGTTQNGGTYGYGVAFELSPSGGGSWTETVLHAFAENSSDGGYPNAVIFDKQGNLYGTAYHGGKGDGVVFELSPSSNGSWTETIIHNFGVKSTDGSNPQAGLVLRNGEFYGTTEHSGGGLGAIYRLARTKTGWKEQIVHNFASNGMEGFPPKGVVVFDKAGNLYDTTIDGGMSGYGTVFELSPTSGSWSETILYSFTGKSDGAYPYFGLTLDSVGNLYGATSGGGDGSAGTGSGDGVIFEVTP